MHGRFATGDLDSILAAKGLDPTRRGADEDTSLAQGTSGWNLFGLNIIDAPEAGHRMTTTTTTARRCPPTSKR